jgi:hypothetical protein
LSYSVGPSLVWPSPLLEYVKKSEMITVSSLRRFSLLWCHSF